MNTNPALEPVVAVCGSEARIYGPVNSKGRRPLIRVQQFQHHGAAVQFAQDFEDPDNQRGKVKH